MQPAAENVVQLVPADRHKAGLKGSPVSRPQTPTLAGRPGRSSAVWERCLSGMLYPRDWGGHQADRRWQNRGQNQLWPVSSRHSHWRTRGGLPGQAPQITAEFDRVTGQYSTIASVVDPKTDVAMTRTCDHHIPTSFP